MKRILVLAFILLSLPALTWADSLWISTTGATPPGSYIAVDVYYTPGAGLLGAYDITLKYDSSLLTALGPSFGDRLGGPYLSVQESSFGTGTVTFTETSVLSDLSGLQTDEQPFLLFGFLLQGNSPGFSYITLDSYTGFDATPNANALSLTSNSPTVQVTETAGVPEPASILLVGCGSLVLLVRRRR